MTNKLIGGIKYISFINDKNAEEDLERQYDITVAGHICLDIIPQIPDTGIREISELFKPGKLINVTAAKISTGGPVSNTGIATKKLKDLKDYRCTSDPEMQDEIVNEYAPLIKYLARKLVSRLPPNIEIDDLIS